MERKRIVALLTCVMVSAALTPPACTAQGGNEPRVAAYAEAYGNTGLLSANIDVLFRNGLLFRFGGLPLFGDDPSLGLDDSWKANMDGVLLVTMVGAAIGDGPLRLETGLGLTFGLREGDGSPGAEDEFGMFTATIGLRHQPFDEKIMFRLGFTPRLDGNHFRPGIGFSIGATLDDPE